MDLSLEISSSGRIRATSSMITLETWCSDSQLNNIQHWPEDKLVCNILLGLQLPNAHLVASTNFVKVINNCSYMYTYIVLNLRKLFFFFAVKAE